jgi:hypothetical protein
MVLDSVVARLVRATLGGVILAVSVACGTIDAARQPSDVSSTSAETPPPPASTVLPSTLLGADVLLATTGRSTLRICVYVDPVLAISPERAASLFDQTLNELAPRSAGARLEPVDLCPIIPLYLATNSRHPKNSSMTLTAAPHPRVTGANIDPHILRVAVTTPERIVAIFGTLSQTRGSEEFQCDGGQCWEVTSSIYVRPDDVDLPEARRMAVLKGLGLIPPR